LQQDTNRKLHTRRNRNSEFLLSDVAPFTWNSGSNLRTLNECHRRSRIADFSKNDWTIDHFE